MSNVTIRYCKLTTRRVGEATDTIIYIPCLQIPSTEEAMLFLNHVYSENQYTEVKQIEEVSREEAESVQGFDPEAIFVTNFYEVCANNSDGEEMLCLTSVSDTAPSSEILMKCINFSRAECEKITKINSVKKVDMAFAVTHYNMGDWMRPCDLEA